MIRIAHLIHAFLSLLFAVTVADLDSPSFEKRQAATKHLRQRLPFSWPALSQANENSESPEVRQRSEDILDGAIRPRTDAEFFAVFDSIVADDWECCGIPWTRKWCGAWFRSNRAAQFALVKYAGTELQEGVRTRFLEDGETMGWDGRWVEYGASLILNDLRFARIGMPPTSEPIPWYVVRWGWQMKKAFKPKGTP